MPDVDPIAPRTRHLLMVAAEMLPDQGREDIDEDDPARWLLFDRYPRITHGRDAGWRRRALRAYGDLAAIINSGQFPRPGCTAEEMALWLIIELAAAFEQDRDAWPTIWSELQALPATADDFNWDELREDLFEDHDFLMLYSPDLDGIEDPLDHVNTQLRIGPYLRPQDWFTPFGESAN